MVSYGMAFRTLISTAALASHMDDPAYAIVDCRSKLDDVEWGARPADILTELPNGKLQLDVRRFHDIVATKPTEDFPYPQPSPASTGPAP